MTIDNVGKVGIGTTSPDQILEINGWISRTAHNNGGFVVVIIILESMVVKQIHLCNWQ